MPENGRCDLTRRFTGKITKRYRQLVVFSGWRISTS